MDKAIQTQLANIEKRTGKSIAELTAVIKSSGLTKHGEIRDMLKRDLATPWAVKGLVMRTVVEAAGDRSVDTTDGVRIVEPDGRWVMVLPDPAEAVTHLWAEGPDDASALALLDEWAAVVDSAGR